MANIKIDFGEFIMNLNWLFINFSGEKGYYEWHQHLSMKSFCLRGLFKFHV